MQQNREAVQDGADIGDGLAGKYLTFGLEGEEYGVGILKVQEIIRYTEITKVPRLPAFVKGVINLRGKVLPVVDLRSKFQMEEIEVTAKTCIIVVQVDRKGIRLTMGIIVDDVSEVINIPSEDIEPPPPMGLGIDTTFILGIAKSKGRVKILLDIDKVLSGEELEAVHAAG